jgi:hypothetical protein
MAARDELVAAIAGRYAQGDRAERGRILDEFAAVTDFHRKHAMRLLRAGQVTRRCGPRRGRRVYDEAVREALIVVWEASDRICGKRRRGGPEPLWIEQSRHQSADQSVGDRIWPQGRPRECGQSRTDPHRRHGGNGRRAATARGASANRASGRA